ncbi:MAG: GerW family sporulation protein [Clostridiales bacterium]|nr:GerW family sporulation protein [Clostridiales bacterium]MCF8021245.1 GerW family sporulation protein [Clostridiales bacterium]
MPEQHPIEGLMKTTMENLKQMTDVNTVIGDAVESPDGSVIIPISKVACGFGAGGGEFETVDESSEGQSQESLPLFGGGSGGGVSVKPLGFLVVGNGQLRMLPVDCDVTIDRIIDLVPQLISQIKSMINKNDESYEMRPQATSPPPSTTPPPQTPPQR